MFYSRFLFGFYRYSPIVYTNIYHETVLFVSKKNWNLFIAVVLKIKTAYDKINIQYKYLKKCII